MKRYYVADTWSDGAIDFCYIITMSTTEGVRVYIAQVIGDKYIVEDDCTQAVENVVPLAEMFEGAYELEAKQIYTRVSREETMPRKKEFETALLVRMSKEQYEKLQNMAHQKGCSQAEVLRRYINKAKSHK